MFVFGTCGEFSVLFSLPKGPFSRFEASREGWVLALPRMSRHVSHAWTSLALRSVVGVDSRGPPLLLSRLIDGR